MIVQNDAKISDHRVDTTIDIARTVQMCSDWSNAIAKTLLVIITQSRYVRDVNVDMAIQTAKSTH